MNIIKVDLAHQVSFIINHSRATSSVASASFYSSSRCLDSILASLSSNDWPISSNLPPRLLIVYKTKFLLRDRHFLSLTYLGQSHDHFDLFFIDIVVLLLINCCLAGSEATHHGLTVLTHFLDRGHFVRNSIIDIFDLKFLFVVLGPLFLSFVSIRLGRLICYIGNKRPRRFEILSSLALAGT